LPGSIGFVASGLIVGGSATTEGVVALDGIVAFMGADEGFGVGRDDRGTALVADVRLPPSDRPMELKIGISIHYQRI
jgi:hypothetical protein